MTSSPSPQCSFVQFLHPGREQRVSGSFKPWNRDEHRRGFLCVDGDYVTSTAGTPVARGRLGFWGEWEAEADVKPVFPKPTSDAPTQLLEPYYAIPHSYAALQNTDPFVFGDRFLYCCCKQFRRATGRATSLAALGRGSVILFGSQLHGRFVLDTVFVIRDYKDYRPADARQTLRGHVPQAFLDVTIGPLAGAKSSLCRTDPDDSEFSDDDEREAACAPASGCVSESLRLYFGATVASPVDGMFSYSPCIVLDGDVADGFSRPAVTHPIIQPAMSRGYRLNETSDGQRNPRIWTEVTEKVLEAKLHLGVRFALPPRRDP